MKRLFSLVLACLLLLSIFGVCPVAATNPEETQPAAQETTAPSETEPEATEAETTEPEVTEPEETGMKTSDDLIELLKFEEGFCKYPVWDYSQYTVGYGTRCPDDKVSYYRANGITQKEAEALLRNTLANTEYLLNTKMIEKYGLNLTQGQFDALVSFSYNMGPGWITSPSQNIHKQVAAGATGNTIIDALSRWCKAGGAVQSFLIRRRLSESYMYLEGKYAHTPPDNYCYIKYSGNGGSTGQSVQGYNSDYQGAPTGIATYGSYTFSGWYTARSGGEKVEVLTKELNGTTLYAHWNEHEYEEPELFDEPIVVKVTANSVNLRKGPGTNYARVGSAEAGDTFEIWQIEADGSYTWGYYKSGWIALEYTNYEAVIGGTEEEPSEPTEPDETQPAPTEPEETEPEPTDPPAKPIYGVVKADPYLCVRQGPGTAYPTVDTLRNGEKVEITEQKVVGSMIWGKVSSGWISMAYVTVDDFESEVDPGTLSGKTGVVTCAKLNVRYGAGVGYSIVGEYRQGDTVTISEQKTVGTTTWGKTAKGWVSMDYISFKQPQEPEQQPDPDEGTDKPENPSTGLTGVVNSDDVLRIRSGAGTNYGIVGYYNPKDKITILEQKTVGAIVWGRTSKGWVSMSYVTLDGEEEEKEPQPSTGKPGVVTCSKLYIRGGAGTSYSAIGYYSQNEKVTILEQKTVGSITWGRTSKGWVSMDYIKLDSDAGAEDTTRPEETPEDQPQTMVRTVNVGSLCVRSGAGTGYKVVTYLVKGAKVTVTETKMVGSSLWGKISNGWICLDYTV